MKKFYFLLLTACVITLAGTAQSWTSYTTLNGLVDNNVRSLTVDNQGVKWFGTQSGVSKFDGSTWTTYNYSTGNLPANFAYSIKVDAQNNKWIGTVAGITKFDGTTWTTYNTTNGLANNTVYAIDQDTQGNIWIGTSGGGISKFDGSTFTNYTTTNGLAANYVNSLSIDAQGIMWIGTNQGVSKFDGTTFTNYNTTNGLVNNTVYSIAFDTQGNKWFGTMAGVSKFDGTTWTNYTTSNGLPHNFVRSIVIDDQGNKWIGTGAGVAKYNGSTFTTYTTSNGLVNNIVNAITIDAQGNRWHGTNGGISKYAAPVTTIDAGITAISSPVGSNNLSNAEQVTVSIKNFGNTAISSGLSVKYKLDNGTVVSETHSGSIAAGATVSHTFASTINLSADGSYSLKAFTSITGDANAANDTITVSIVNPIIITDAGVNAISAPVSSTNLTNAEHVTVSIKNFGNTAIASGLMVKYQLNNGSVVSETHTGSIAAGATASHTFTTTINLGTNGTYILKAYTTLIGDDNDANDTTSASIIKSSVGIEEIKTDNSFNVYPNPAQNSLSIDNIKKDSQVSIYSIHGKLMYEAFTNNTHTTIDISSFEKGIYSIHITDTANSSSTQFIKL